MWCAKRSPTSCAADEQANNTTAPLGRARDGPWGRGRARGRLWRVTDDHLALGSRNATRCARDARRLTDSKTTKPRRSVEDEVKALSVREPWASMIASGAKTLEIRSRRTHYRGPLVICASRGGGAVAIVDLVDCRSFRAEDDAASGGVWSRYPTSHAHYAWEMRVIRRVSSGVIKGRLGFFDVDVDHAGSFVTALPTPRSDSASSRLHRARRQPRG